MKKHENTHNYDIYACHSQHIGGVM